MLEPQQFQTQGFIDLRLCRERHNSGIASATAFVPALVNSGLPNDKFVFEGFYLKKRKTNPLFGSSRRNAHDILYVSPHKLLKH
jgi:16S rRNA (cytidine1402-2'-O)-methyltransferase